MKFTKNPEKFVDGILDWAESRMTHHQDSEDYHICLAIAQEFHEWFIAEKGETVDYVYTKYPLKKYFEDK